MITVNSKKASTGFDPLPDGEYEVFVTGAAKTASKSSPAEGIGLILTVRDDVEQVGKGRKVRKKVWFTDKNEENYQQFLTAMNFPDGQNFGSLEEIAEAVKALPVRVRMRKDRQNPEYNDVSVFKVTSVGGFYEGEIADPSAPSHASAAAEQFHNDNKPIAISDDDLPF